MQRVHASLSISLDGFASGPSQSVDAPLGVGGERLHEWAWATRSMRTLHGLDGGETGVDDEWAARHVDDIGATVMGRHMFGPTRGAWGDPAWRGWWGDTPPFHHPVFVLTSFPREPLLMDGGTTFHFVTGGIPEALALARNAAGAADVRVGGGAHTVRQFLDEGLVDELHLAIAPVLLGSGQRVFEEPASVAARYHVAEMVRGERAVHTLLKLGDG